MVQATNLSVSQATVFQKVVACLESQLSDNQRDNTFFVGGPAGSGKSFLLNTILAYCQMNRISSIAVAFTGIAACSLQNGKTVHSCFRLPWNKRKLRCSIHPDTRAYSDIKQAKIIVWDQAASCSKHVFEVVDSFLKNMMNTKRLFGGKVVVICGDFRECLPITRKSRDENEESHSILFSNVIWPHLQRFSLMENYRFQVADDFQLCLDIGAGVFDPINIPNKCRVYNLDTLINTIYGCDYTTIKTDDLMTRSILALCNHTVDFLNEKCLFQLYEKQYIYNSFNFFRKLNVNERSAFYFIEDFMQTLPQYFPPETVNVNINCPIMLRQSYKGLPQGTRLVVKQLKPNVIIAEIGCGHRKGKILQIRKVTTTLGMPRSNLEFVRVQFPVSLAYSMSINKAQGLDFKRLGIYFNQMAFAHGQMYVALSRVPNIEENLKVFVDEERYSFDQIPNLVNHTIAKLLAAKVEF